MSADRTRRPLAARARSASRRVWIGIDHDRPGAGYAAGTQIGRHVLPVLADDGTAARWPTEAEARAAADAAIAWHYRQTYHDPGTRLGLPRPAR